MFSFVIVCQSNGIPIMGCLHTVRGSRTWFVRGCCAERLAQRLQLGFLLLVAGTLGYQGLQGVLEGSQRGAYAVDTAVVATAGSRVGIVEMKREEVGRLREGENDKGWTGECQQRMGRWRLRRRVMREDCSLLRQPKVLPGSLLLLEAVGEGRGCCSRTSLSPSETLCLLGEVAGLVGFVLEMTLG